MGRSSTRRGRACRPRTRYGFRLRSRRPGGARSASPLAYRPVQRRVHGKSRDGRGPRRTTWSCDTQAPATRPSTPSLPHDGLDRGAAGSLGQLWLPCAPSRTTPAKRRAPASTRSRLPGPGRAAPAIAPRWRRWRPAQLRHPQQREQVDPQPGQPHLPDALRIASSRRPGRPRRLAHENPACRLARPSARAGRTARGGSMKEMP